MLALVISLTSAALLQVTATSPIRLTVRVYDGTRDASAEAVVRVYAAGDRKSPVGEARQPITIAPGYYDLQVLKQEANGFRHIRWKERLLIQRYPGEGDGRLEVLNLQTGYGAVRVRVMAGQAADARLVRGAGRGEAPSFMDGADAVFVAPVGDYVIASGAGARRPVKIYVDQTQVVVIE